MAGRSTPIDLRFILLVIFLFTLFIFFTTFTRFAQPRTQLSTSLRISDPSELTRYINGYHYQDLRQQPGQLKEILIYQGYNSWSGLEVETLRTPNYLGDSVVNVCPVKCSFTSDPRRWREADAFIFESDTPHFVQWRQKPLKFPQKLPHQKWVLVSYETKYYYPQQLYYEQMTDITMSYEQGSDVPISFMCSWGGGTLADLLKPPPPKPAGYAPIVWMGTNCGAGGAGIRQRYIEELMKHISVDSYGGCLHNRDLPKEWQFPIYSDHGSSMRNKILMFGNYKFVLAFENNNVTDYVTEKIMNVFQSGSIPVYMGAPNIEEWAPPNSYIRTDKFKGPADLAKYLKKVLNDKNLYNSFFKWKEEGLPPYFIKKYSQCIFYQGRCRLCQKIASTHPIRTDFPKELLNGWTKPSYLKHSSLQSYAVMFTGDGYVDLGKSSHWDLQREFTLTAWILPREFSDLRIVDKNKAGELHGIEFDVLEVGHRAYLRICTVECWLGVKPLQLDSWQHVAVTFDSTEEHGVFYVNGEYDTDFLIYSGPAPLNDLPVHLGSAPGGLRGWKGRIDDVTIWKRALSAKEVKDLMFKGLLGNETGLLGSYSFDEGTGNEVHDSSRWARHGKLVNGKWVEQWDKPYYVFDHVLPEHRNSY
eukprot:TRINITY_DN4004_c0_g1_i1.p1 TRINITY_DN4004_c0_g1~~TRINITY_DN4004_c0_g1_i1.p1  ORF type:complete len:643 (-),score=96.02 TRINITY_DN4004_c0_g1_i1:140-2068(-)